LELRRVLACFSQLQSSWRVMEIYPVALQLLPLISNSSIKRWLQFVLKRLCVNT